MEHLRFSGVGEPAQRAELERIIRSSPLLMEVLTALRDDALPDHLLVAGALYNLVWNRLTGRPDLTGINDIDVFYFDDRDLSYDAEDLVIQRFAETFAHLPLPVQIRNQARVHLWFEQKFGSPFSPLAYSAEMLTRYASRSHAVAARLETDGSLTLHAPFGLEDIFSMRVTPNPVLANKKAHDAKAARAKTIWPEVTVVPWPDF